MIKVEYELGHEKEVIDEQESKGMILLEKQNHVDGNFLIFGTLEDYVDRHVRPDRNKKLQESDIYMLADNAEELKAQGKYEDMKLYRKALRDLPKTITSTDFEWPEMPKVLLEI